MKMKQTSTSLKTGKRAKGGNRSVLEGVDVIQELDPTTKRSEKVTSVVASSASAELINSMTIRTYAGNGTKLRVDIRKKPKAKTLGKPRKPKASKVYGKKKTKTTKSPIEEADEKFWEQCKLLEDEDRCVEEEKERISTEQDDLELWEKLKVAEAWNIAHPVVDDEAERCGWLEMKDDIKHEETKGAGGHGME